MSAATEVRLAAASDIAPGTARRFVIGDRELAVYHTEGAFYATDDLCTHRRARLSDGYLDGRVIQCPLHFGKFDVITGQPLNPPCKIPVASYPVIVRENELFVEIPSNASV